MNRTAHTSIPADWLTAECPVCGGAGRHLGDLGCRRHFRCRACGMNFSLTLNQERKTS
jgi:hypothetical protein